jgi:predicted HTH domain antitoxin
MATDRRNTAVEDKQELATTIGLYVLGEISLGKAAERTGMIRWEMEELLQKAGVELQLGPQSMDGLDDEVDVALDLD